MSQKINIISNKLGVFYLWNSNFPIKGNNFQVYKKHLKIRKYIKKYIAILARKNQEKLGQIKYNYFNNCVLITIPFFVKSCDLKKSAQLVAVLRSWLKFPVVIKYYNIFFFSLSATVLSNYIKTNNEIYNTPLKKLLNYVYITLLKQKSKYKIIYTTYGLKLVQFLGFKIQISGCFDSSKNQMSKTLVYKSGTNSLTKLKNYVEYSKITIYTKFGTCGLKVWLFFETI